MNGSNAFVAPRWATAVAYAAASTPVEGVEVDALGTGFAKLGVDATPLSAPDFFFPGVTGTQAGGRYFLGLVGSVLTGGINNARLVVLRAPVNQYGSGAGEGAWSNVPTSPYSPTL